MNERDIYCVSGLYFYARDGKSNYPQKIISEIEKSLELNLWYKQNIICYADTKEMAKILRAYGLYVHKVFDDAPNDIKHNAAHKMKHWIMFHAAKEFKHVLWIDWDTYLLKPLDDTFKYKCMASLHPKFTYIPNYWATVNCSVYYLNDFYLDLMEKSFYADVPVPNDELLWKSVLPENVTKLKEYWLDDMVVNIWHQSDFLYVTKNTYFLHLKDFNLLKYLSHETIRNNQKNKKHFP